MVSDCSSRSRAVKSNRDAARLSQENLRALEASHYEVGQQMY